MKVLRRPLTLNVPSRGVPPVVRFDEPSLTPVVNSASAEYSRPFNGSARVWSPVMTWPRWLESVSIRGDSPLTVTASSIAPTLKLDVDALPAADLDLHLGRLRREPGQLGSNGVVAGAHREELVGAALVGHLRRGHAGGRVQQRDRRARQHRTARIADDAQNGSGVELRPRRGRHDPHRQHEGQPHFHGKDLDCSRRRHAPGVKGPPYQAAVSRSSSKRNVGFTSSRIPVLQARGGMAGCAARVLMHQRTTAPAP